MAKEFDDLDSQSLIATQHEAEPPKTSEVSKQRKTRAAMACMLRQEVSTDGQEASV